MQLSIIKNAAVLLFAGGLATSASISVLAQQGATDGQWRTYGGDAGSTRYSSLDQINASNAAELEVAWMWKADSLLPGAQATSEVNYG